MLCVTVVPVNPCIPSPCGPNTNCRVVNGAAVCECLPDFQGAASTFGCKPECVISADCPRNRACVNNKCVDPCPGVCGFRALCQVINHSPVCSCPPPLVGDPFAECKNIPRKLISSHLSDVSTFQRSVSQSVYCAATVPQLSLTMLEFLVSPSTSQTQLLTVSFDCN